MVQNYKMMTI